MDRNKAVAAMALVAACLAPPARAQSVPGREASSGNDIVAGLLVNQTVSALGLEFYRDFAEYWRDKPEADNYNLEIVERPSRRFGNQITVTYGQKRLYVLTLPFKFDRVRPAAEQAVETSYANMISLLIPDLERDPDLGGDEM